MAVDKDRYACAQQFILCELVSLDAGGDQRADQIVARIGVSVAKHTFEVLAKLPQRTLRSLRNLQQGPGHENELDDSGDQPLIVPGSPPGCRVVRRSR